MAAMMEFESRPCIDYLSSGSAIDCTEVEDLLSVKLGDLDLTPCECELPPPPPARALPLLPPPSPDTRILIPENYRDFEIVKSKVERLKATGVEVTMVNRLLHPRIVLKSKVRDNIERATDEYFQIMKEHICKVKSTYHKKFATGEYTTHDGDNATDDDAIDDGDWTIEDDTIDGDVYDEYFRILEEDRLKEYADILKDLDDMDTDHEFYK